LAIVRIVSLRNLFFPEKAVQQRKSPPTIFPPMAVYDIYLTTYKWSDECKGGEARPVNR
jgi:hypothetical protein